jgi:hypothetical protein
MKNYVLIVFALALIFPIFVSAHPGRIDSSGCHTCKTNCSNWGLSYGEYHCHNSKGVTQPLEPVKSTYGAAGGGYTNPAPEYKTPGKLVIPPKQIPKAEVVNKTVAAPVVSETTAEKKGWFSNLFSWLFN